MNIPDNMLLVNNYTATKSFRNEAEDVTRESRYLGPIPIEP